MRVVVTGAAGFVGSHLVETLAAAGHGVVGIDCLLPDSYSASIKQAQFRRLADVPSVTMHEADLRTAELTSLLDGADAVINEAAMPGLVKSWPHFDLYTSCNLLAVDRLIEAATAVGIPRFVQISTSSVYGEYAVGDESQPTEPFSPYGVSKLAAEKLVLAHVANFGFPSVILRYFSLYGPRQRPDMGYHIFCEAMRRGLPISIFGDGRQRRSNTFVRDAVDATVLALTHGDSGDVLNVSGGQSVELLEAVAILADELGVDPVLEFGPARPGDQRITQGDSSRAEAVLGWRSSTDVEAGLRAQARWHRKGSVD